MQFLRAEISKMSRKVPRKLFWGVSKFPGSSAPSGPPPIGPYLNWEAEGASHPKDVSISVFNSIIVTPVTPLELTVDFAHLRRHACRARRTAHRGARDRTSRSIHQSRRQCRVQRSEHTSGEPPPVASVPVHCLLHPKSLLLLLLCRFVL